MTHKVNSEEKNGKINVKSTAERHEIFMNEKFFDLKKEKQDRMINASLKIFAMNGYGHASTDDIVKEAGISKGLLFFFQVKKFFVHVFLYST